MLLWQNSIWREQKVKKLVSQKNSLNNYERYMLFFSWLEFWPGRILKLNNSCSKFTWTFFFYQLFFFLSLKKTLFCHSQKDFKTPKSLQTKNLPQIPLGSSYSPSRPLIWVYSCTSKICKTHVYILDVVAQQEKNSLLYE